MGECEKLKDKFIAFDELDTDEQTRLLNHLTACEKCRREFSEHGAILAALADYETPSVTEEQLLRYAIQKAKPDEPDFDGRFLPSAEFSRVERILAQHPIYVARVKKITEELRGAEDFFKDAGLPDISLNDAPSRQPATAPRTSFIRKFQEFFRKPIPRLLPIPAIAAVVLIFAVLPHLLKTQNPYYAHAFVYHSEFSFITRGQTETELASAYAAFQSQNIPLAIRKLERLEAGQTDPLNLARIEYILGISYLLQAPKSFLWIKEDYDRENVTKGIEHLTKAANLTDVKGFKENCTWYLGKAYLMVGDKEKALLSLGKVMDLKGRRYMAAANLAAILRR